MTMLTGAPRSTNTHSDEVGHETREGRPITRRNGITLSAALVAALMVGPAAREPTRPCEISLSEPKKHTHAPLTYYIGLFVSSSKFQRQQEHLLGLSHRKHATDVRRHPYYKINLLCTLKTCKGSCMCDNEIRLAASSHKLE